MKFVFSMCNLHEQFILIWHRREFQKLKDIIVLIHIFLLNFNYFMFCFLYQILITTKVF